MQEYDNSEFGWLEFLKANLFQFIIYVFIYVLFVWKYTGESRPYPKLVFVFYVIIVPVLLIVLMKFLPRLIPFVQSGRFYVAFIIFLSAVLTVLMFQFDPGDIFIGRWWALNDWIGKLISGQFPYRSAHLPSGLPFLFVLAMPFYFLGDAGLLQICAFILLAVAMHLRYRKKPASRLRGVIFLAASPVFLFEVLVRSELIFNVTIVLLYLEIVFQYVNKDSLPKPALFGFIGGLLLSTRGIVLPVYIIFLGFLFLRYHIRSVSFYLFMIIGFAVTIVPFLLWNADYFLTYGPFSVQLHYIPSWLLIIALLSSLICAISVKSIRGAHIAIGSILFGVVFIAFLVSIGENGLTASVMKDLFDTGYFAFTLPFLVISFRYSSNSS